MGVGKRALFVKHDGDNLLVHVFGKRELVTTSVRKDKLLAQDGE